MRTILAAQHIYANVESDESPHKRGGFQTLFYTQNSLSETEVEEIESRMAYFRANENPCKRVFFTIPTGKTVLGQIVLLSGTDRLGRQGRYLAHSLVLMPEAFTLPKVSPLGLFGTFQFVTTLEQAWVEGNGDNGDLPLATLSLPEKELDLEVDAANAWPKDELWKLILLALRANDLSTDRSMLALIGAPESIENALLAAFVAVPLSLRTACSFDTHFVGCNPVALSYWAVGLPEPPDSPLFVQVDTQQKKVIWQDQRSKHSSYERWVWACLDARDMRYLAEYRDQSFGLCKWLEGRCVGNLETQEFDPGVVESVFKANQALVRDRVRTKLTDQTSARLADHICKRIHCETKPIQLLRFLRTGFDLALVLQKLYEVYRDKQFAKPIEEEMDSLGTLFTKAEHPCLQIIHACWTQNQGHVRNVLLQMSDEKYREFLHIAFRCSLMDPFELIVLGKGEAFLELYLNALCREDHSLLALASVLLGRGEAKSLSKLIPLLRNCTNRQLARLKRLVDTHSNVPSSFRVELVFNIFCRRNRDVPWLAKSLLDAGEISSLDKLIPLVASCSNRQLMQLNELVNSYPDIPHSFRNVLMNHTETHSIVSGPGAFSRLRARFFRKA